MAINAVIFQLHFFYGREGAACLVRRGRCLRRLTGLAVAAHAAEGERGGLVELINVHVVAGSAIHLGGFETFTGREQSVLIAMDVEGGRVIRRIVGRGEFIQRIPHPERKRGLYLLSEPGMTKSAGIESLLTTETARADDVPSFFFPGMGRVPGHVCGCRSVTSLAVDAVHHAVFFEAYCPIVQR